VLQVHQAGQAVYNNTCERIHNLAPQLQASQLAAALHHTGLAV
jgi:hypothetical protein